MDGLPQPPALPGAGGWAAVWEDLPGVDGVMPGGLGNQSAPTYRQAKRIAWKPLKQMTKEYWTSKPNETDLSIELIGGGNRLARRRQLRQPARRRARLCS